MFFGLNRIISRYDNDTRPFFKDITHSIIKAIGREWGLPKIKHVLSH